MSVRPCRRGLAPVDGQYQPRGDAAGGAAAAAAADVAAHLGEATVASCAVAVAVDAVDAVVVAVRRGHAPRDAPQHRLAGPFTCPLGGYQLKHLLRDEWVG